MNRFFLLVALLPVLGARAHELPKDRSACVSALSDTKVARQKLRSDNAILENTFRQMFFNRGIIDGDCYIHIQYLLKAAYDAGIDIDRATVLSIFPKQRWLVPRSHRYPETSWMFHVVLEYNQKIYDFALTNSENTAPLIYDIHTYFDAFFPKNDKDTLFIKRIPARLALLEQHRSEAINFDKLSDFKLILYSSHKEIAFYQKLLTRDHMPIAEFTEFIATHNSSD